MPLFDGLSLEGDRRDSNPRPSLEPQSADTCFCVLRAQWCQQRCQHPYHVVTHRALRGQGAGDGLPSTTETSLVDLPYRCLSSFLRSTFPTTAIPLRPRVSTLPYLRRLRPHSLPVPVAPLIGVCVPVAPEGYPLTSYYDFDLRGVSNEGHLTTQAYFYGIGLPHKVVDIAGCHCPEVFFL